LECHTDPTRREYSPCNTAKALAAHVPSESSYGFITINNQKNIHFRVSHLATFGTSLAMDFRRTKFQRVEEFDQKDAYTVCQLDKAVHYPKLNAPLFGIHSTKVAPL
jgi:hypothetical protein